MSEFSERQIEIMEAATARIDKYGIQKMTIKNLAEDIGISEPALYRHFKSKNDILSGLLTYFKLQIESRVEAIHAEPHPNNCDELREIFNSHLSAFTDNPAIVSVIFSENIFHFNKELRTKVAEIMDLMQGYVHRNVAEGQECGHYHSMIDPKTLTTIIVGSMRMTVLKWKLTGHKSNLLEDGRSVLEGILRMIEIKH